MNQQKVSYHIHCDKYQPKKDGTATLYLRLTINRKSKFISLSKCIDPKYFDFKKKRVKNTKGAPNPQKLNRFLNTEENRVDDIILELQRRNKPITFDNVLKEYKGADTNGSFDAYAKEVIASQRNRLKKDTKSGYEYMLNKIEKYHPGLKLYEVDTAWLQRFSNYLIEELNNKQNTVHLTLRTMRMFVKHAFDEGVINSYPFKNFSFEKEEVDKEHLSLEELNSLHEFYDSRELLDLRKQDKRGKSYHIGKKYQELLQHFLIGCYSGLRLSDIRKLRKKHIQNAYIVIQMNKGREGKQKTVRIPIRGRLQSVLNLDRMDDKVYEGLVRGKSDVSAWMKLLMKEAGVYKHITFHCSRHTFAISCLTLGMSLETVSDLLGHRDIKTTQIYAKIVDAKRDNEMDLWDNLPEVKKRYLTKVS